VIPIDFDELAAVLRRCTRLRPAECSPAQLKALMADHRRHTDHSLAEKVLAFDGPQRIALSAFVLQAQARSAWQTEDGREAGPKAAG